MAPQEPIKCTLCSKEFTAKGTLRVHIESVHNSHVRPFACDECEQTFTRKTTLNMHKQDVHSTEYPFICPRCPCTFKRNSCLNQHLMVAHEGQRYECDICGTKYKHKGSLKAHYAQHEFKRLGKSLSCAKCGRTFTHRISLATHMRISHPKELPYKCSLCPMSYCQLSGLEVHKANKHTQLQCETCLKKYSTRRGVTNHKCCGFKPRVQCARCRSGFKALKELKKHVCTYEKCFLCQAAFENREKLIEHLETQHHPRESTLCDLCGNTYQSPARLLLHQTTLYNSASQNYPCDQCGQNFTEKYLRLAHVHEEHTVRQQCPLCEEIFTMPQIWASHQAKFEENFQCCKCQAQFLSQECFSEHKAFHLEDERPLHCEQCEFHFSDKDAHANHMQLHSEYFCEFCGLVIYGRVLIIAHKLSHKQDQLSLSPHHCKGCKQYLGCKSEMEEHLRHCPV